MRIDFIPHRSGLLEEIPLFEQMAFSAFFREEALCVRSRFYVR
jgi:hypothetical protein